MTRGIGVRYSEHGLRALMLERENDELTITGVAAGPHAEEVDGFLTEHGFPRDDTAVAVGLGPGDFLSCWMGREPGMEERDIEEHLRWEFESKVSASPASYAAGFYLSGDTGFLFAARKELLDELHIPQGAKEIVDVEPVALFNACEAMGETGKGTAVLVSVEAEGLSSTVIEDGSPVAVESFAAPQDTLLRILPGLDFLGGEIDDEEAAEQLVKYVSGSVSRLVSRLKLKKRPDRIVLAGGGVYVGDLESKVKEKTGIRTSIADPFASTKRRVATLGPRLPRLGSAFASCYGIALRAMEG